MPTDGKHFDVMQAIYTEGDKVMKNFNPTIASTDTLKPIGIAEVQEEIVKQLATLSEEAKFVLLEVLLDDLGIEYECEDMWDDGGEDEYYEPDRILKSGDRTIVFWRDGEKTIVKRSEDDEDNEYTAFTAALTKKIFGSNSTIKKIIRDKTQYQKEKKVKEQKV